MVKGDLTYLLFSCRGDAMILTLLEMKFKAFVLMTISFACLMVIINIKVNIYRKVLFISTRSSLHQHEPALFQFLDFHPDQRFVTTNLSNKFVDKCKSYINDPAKCRLKMLPLVFLVVDGLDVGLDPT